MRETRKGLAAQIPRPQASPGTRTQESQEPGRRSCGLRASPGPATKQSVLLGSWVSWVLAPADPSGSSNAAVNTNEARTGGHPSSLRDCDLYERPKGAGLDQAATRGISRRSRTVPTLFRSSASRGSSIRPSGVPRPSKIRNPEAGLFCAIITICTVIGRGPGTTLGFTAYDADRGERVAWRQDGRTARWQETRGRSSSTGPRSTALSLARS